MTATILEHDIHVDREVETSNEAGSVAHIVRSMDPLLSPAAYVLKARVEGIPLVALCGYIWLPNRDASKLPVCQKCKEIFELNIAFGDSDDDRLPEAA